MHQFNVFHVAVIVIISGITITSILNCAWLMSEYIPIAEASVTL